MEAAALRQSSWPRERGATERGDLETSGCSSPAPAATARGGEASLLRQLNTASERAGSDYPDFSLLQQLSCGSGHAGQMLGVCSGVAGLLGGGINRARCAWLSFAAGRGKARAPASYRGMGRVRVVSRFSPAFVGSCFFLNTWGRSACKPGSNRVLGRWSAWLYYMFFRLARCNKRFLAGRSCHPHWVMLQDGTKEVGRSIWRDDLALPRAHSDGASHRASSL